MLPRPFPFRPKPRRLPKRKRMTVVVGIKNNDSVIVTADREENDLYLRDDVSKIEVCTLGNGWVIGFAGAGDSAFIDFSVQKLRDKLEKTKSLSPIKLRSTIESELL